MYDSPEERDADIAELASQPVGFALSIQGGVAYVAARADAKDSSGRTASASDSSIAPLINVNLGWAF